MMPDDFWNSTFDECLLLYRGYIKGLAFKRSLVDLIHKSLVEKPIDIKLFSPLPFDSDTQESEQDLAEEYKRLGGIING